jgi:hypothetical protein
MNYGTYYVFITALISSYEDMIIAALVKKGFQVSPLAESNQVTISDKDSVCAMIALRIDTDMEIAYEIHNEIQEVLISMNIVYYSLVVTESADCCWNISNIRVPKALPPPLPTPTTNVRKPNSGLN